MRTTLSFVPNTNDPSSLFGVGMESLRELVAPDGRVIDRTVVDLKPGQSVLRRGLVLQHYGCPTSWLDITKDPDVALWFALHHLGSITSSGAKATPYTEWPRLQAEWPTVHVFALSSGEHPFLDTEALVAPDVALRPSRQRCGLLGGAANLVRNYAARLIALKVRIGPGVRLLDNQTAEYYFPDEHADPLLAYLVRALQEGRESGVLFPPWYLGA